MSKMCNFPLQADRNFRKRLSRYEIRRKAQLPFIHFRIEFHPVYRLPSASLGSFMSKADQQQRCSCLYLIKQLKQPIHQQFICLRMMNKGTVQPVFSDSVYPKQYGLPADILFQHSIINISEFIRYIGIEN